MTDDRLRREIERLYGPFILRRQTRPGDVLRREIESLLRSEHRGPALARSTRPPVLGAASIGRVGPRGLPDLPLPLWTGDDGALRIEPGLLASMVSPVAVHTTAELREWLAGPGWAIPETDPVVYTHFVGRLVAIPNAPCVAWPDEDPIAPVDGGAYLSSGYSSATALAAVLAPAPPIARIAYPAGPYTGPMRALAEACLAAARSLGSLVPAGASVIPGACGVVWSLGDEVAPRVPWYITIGEGGCTAYRMRVSELTSPIETWVRTGVVTGIAAHLAWLYVLADLETIPEPEDGDVVDLVGAGEMASAYADGGPLVMAGWVWGAESGGTWPGATVCGGTIDTGQAVEAFRTRQVSVEISLAGGVPAATLAIGAGQVFRPYWGYHVFRYRAPDGGLQLLRNARIWPGSDGCDGSAPVLCLFEGASLQVLRYYRAVTVTGGSSTTGGGVGMGCSGGTEFVRGAGITVISGGYGLSDPAPLTVGTGSIVTRTLTRAAPGALEWSGGSSQDASRPLWDAVTYGYQGTSYCHQVYCGNGPFDNVLCRKHSAASVTATTDSLAVTTATGANLVVYLPAAPDCLWIVHGGRAAHRVSSSISGTKGMAAYAEMRIVEYYSWNYHKADPSYWIDRGLHCADSSPYGHTHTYGTAHRFYVWPYPDSQTSGPSSNVYDWTDVVCTVRIGGVVVDAGTWEDWDSLIGDEIGSDPPTLRIDALVSARPGRVWKAYDTGPWATDSGVSLDVMPEAQSWCGG